MEKTWSRKSRVILPLSIGLNGYHMHVPFLQQYEETLLNWTTSPKLWQVIDTIHHSYMCIDVVLHSPSPVKISTSLVEKGNPKKQPNFKDVLWWNFLTIYGARNRLRIGLSYQPAMLHRLAELIPLVSIPGLLQGLKIWALHCTRRRRPVLSI